MESATSERLASLRDAPIEAASFLAALEEQISPAADENRLPRRMWSGRTRAVAASLLAVALVIAFMMNSSSGVVLASAERLAHVHQEVLTAESDHVVRVDSLSAANAAIRAMWPGAPSLPDLPNVPVLYFCLHSISSKKIACVVLNHDGVPVTLLVAAAADLRVPSGETFEVNGTAFRIQACDDVNMVMTERDGEWICLMGRLPLDRIKAIATSLRF